MKRIILLIINSLLCASLTLGQEMDPVFTGTYSGTLTQSGRNCVTLGNGYTFTPSGGSLTIEIQNPIVTGSVVYATTPIDPETRNINTSYLVGTIDGTFATDPAGGAIYTIPIEVMPGINGITPSLSLTYSSNSGPGIAGYGWQIGGLSAISRGPQIYYNDGASRGVELDINDRFYIDGQRLVTTSGNYGDASAIYETDNDIFTRVTPQTTDTYGPGWFKAETKSGLIYEYGNSTGSKQKVTGYNQTVTWYVSSIRDLFNNVIYFSYIQDNNSVYLAEITYGLNATNTITFNYKQRQDVLSGYLKGIKIQTRYILDKVTVKYNSSVVRSYELKYTYEGPSYNFYSNLNEVIENGIETSRFNSTALSYQLPTTVSISPPAPTINHQYISYTSKLITGDYNGDGRADFLCLPINGSYTGIRLCINYGNNNYTPYTIETSAFNDAVDIRAIDLNGDGKDDLLFEITTSVNSIFKYVLNDCTSLAFTTTPITILTLPKSSLTGLCSRTRRVIDYQYDDNEEYAKPALTRKKTNSSPDFADYNGDGVNDIFINTTNGGWYIYSFVNSSGQLTTGLNLLASGTISTLNEEVMGGDFNGDGRTEIWSFKSTGVKIYSFSGTTLNEIYSNSWPSNNNYFNLGDFNGDGKVDVFLYGGGKKSTPVDWASWQIQLSTGTGFEGYSFPQKKQNLYKNYIRLADFNGDGATDIMAVPIISDPTHVRGYISMNNGTDFYTYDFNSDDSYMNDNIYIADFNGDGRSDIAVTSAPQWWSTYCSDCQITPWSGFASAPQNGNTTPLIAKVGNGLGELTKISYAKLSQPVPGLYYRGTGAVYPIANFQGPHTVVNSIQIDNGKGSLNTQNYQYEGAIIHLQGKGLLGYSKIMATNQASSITNESTISGYHSTYFYPLVTKSFSRYSADTINVINETWSHILLDASKKRIFPYVKVTRRTDKLTDHFFTINNSAIDNYGTPTTVIRTYSNGPTETTTNTINNTVSSSQWLLGRPTITTIQFSSGGNNITRTGTRVFSSTSNNITSETWHSGTDQQIVKTFAYNDNGTLSSETATANSQSRTTTCTFKSDNIRIATITDPLAHTTTNTYDNYGRLSTTNDYLNNTKTFQYDNMGRTNLIASPFGSRDTISYAWEEEIVPQDLKRRYYSVKKSSTDGSLTKEKYDNLGRDVRTDKKGFNGTMIYTATVYNQIGQVESISDPYFSNESPLLNIYQYDNYGRKTCITRPSGRNSTFSYTYNTGKIVETTAGKTYTKTYSSDGTLEYASDAGDTIRYSYFPDGKLKRIIAPGGILTLMQYDIAGNQTQLVDPSAGTINYTYSGFGEILTQQNARNQTTSYTYNANGTISQKVSPEGTTVYTYNSNKQLTGISSPGSVSRSFSYNTQGRPSTITETIPGLSDLTTSYTYDALGRESTVTHPSNTVETIIYNSNGYLWHIDVDGSTKWTITSQNAFGQITGSSYGSSPGLSATFGFNTYGLPTSIVAGTIQNYTFGFNNTNGNLSWRRNVLKSKQESFAYDNLDRLDRVYYGLSTLLDMEYDPLKGGITKKSDVGRMNYNTSGKPYAMSDVYESTGLIPAVLDSLTYTSFESVNSIWEEPYYASFVYNSENERAKMEVKENNNVILTRWYAESGYIKETAGGVTKEYTFIGGDAYTAPVVAIKQNGGNTAWYYLLRDHLGSITHVVDASTNTTLYEYSYDAWGRMRNTSTWTDYSPGSEPALFVAGRGFTGHEHLPWFNMINMNGRLYDPLVGQFLSPDNNVQFPDFTQNLNRYSYCLNNPLKYTDPDGEWVITALTMLANMYVSTSAANNWQFNPAKWDWESPKTWVSLVQSGISGYNLGSSLESKYRSYQFSRIRRHATDAEYLQLKGVKFNSDGGLEYSNENARAYYDAVYRKTFIARKGLRAIYADGRPFTVKGNTYSMDDYLGRYIGSEGGYGDAFTVSILGKPISDIYLAKTAFSDLLSLHISIGHELNHVAIHYFNLPVSEAFAYFWQAESYLVNGDIYHYDLYRQVAIDQEYFDTDFSKYYKKGSFGIPYKIGNF